MKGSLEVTDMITVLAISVIFILMMTQIPKSFKEFFDQLVLSSAKVVSNDLAGLISISAAAPQDIIISYNVSLKNINYTADLKNREITIQLMKNGEKIGNSSSSYYAVDNLQKIIENCNNFKISKNRNGLVDTYNFWCGK